MELAAQIGIPITEFWNITPYELSVIAKGFGERKKAEHKESLFQAYLISRWVWQKRINIQKILNAGEKKQPMTDQAMLERVKALNMVFGGEVRTVVKKQFHSKRRSGFFRYQEGTRPDAETAE